MYSWGEGGGGHRKNGDALHFQHFTPFFKIIFMANIHLKNIDVYTFQGCPEKV